MLRKDIDKLTGVDADIVFKVEDRGILDEHRDIEIVIVVGLLGTPG